MILLELSSPKTFAGRTRIEFDKAIQIGQSSKAADINSKMLQGVKAAPLTGTCLVNRMEYAKPVS